MGRWKPPEEEIGDMTPMIDVTFLLLIFFLVNIKFKTLDAKMQIEMPSTGLRNCSRKNATPKYIGTSSTHRMQRSVSPPASQSTARRTSGRAAEAGGCSFIARRSGAGRTAYGLATAVSPPCPSRSNRAP